MFWWFGHILKLYLLWIYILQRYALTISEGENILCLLETNMYQGHGWYLRCTVATTKLTSTILVRIGRSHIYKTKQKVNIAPPGVDGIFYYYSGKQESCVHFIFLLVKLKTGKRRSLATPRRRTLATQILKLYPNQLCGWWFLRLISLVVREKYSINFRKKEKNTLP